MKEERFPHTRKHLRRWRLRVAEGGSFGATEESTATGVRRAKRRDSRTEARTHQPERLVCSPAGAGGAGSRGSGFGWIAGRGLGLAA